MPTGLGWLQRECLRVIELYEADGKTPTTRDIAAIVYRVKRDREGQPLISKAEYFLIRHALTALKQATCKRQARDRRHQERESDFCQARASELLPV
jgi:hypothetical protein